MSLKRLQLFGLPCLVLDAKTVPLGTSRAMQLLAHLAVSGSWHSRDAVARLFWPDRDDKTARSNLRNLLVKAAAAAPHLPLEATQHALRLQTNNDLHEFDTALQQGDWEAAVQIGAGELLQGLDSGATEPYLQWLQNERATRLEQWKQAIQALLAQASRPIQQRQSFVESWGQRCPDDDDAVRAQMALAFERGHASAAVKIFRAYEAWLQQEFGVRPARELERYALQMPAAAEPGAASAPPDVPVSTVSQNKTRPRIFGRRVELAQLGALMADDAVRLITLKGPGGVGKSTLLASLHAQVLDAGRTEARLVDVGMAQDAQAVIALMAAALGIEGLQGASMEVALAATLRDQRCLLMIDGAEQAGLAGPLALLLDRCPQLRLLVASRQRLQLDSEHVLALDGFPLPDSEETDAEVLGSNDAVAYFAAIMQRAGRPPDLARDAATLAALVRAVDGLPLALKLLAQLTHLFSLQQLLDNVRQHMAGTQAADAPAIGELMPAMVASFQRSWTALSPTQQAVLGRLAVFPSSFEITAARSIARTELPVITSLVDCSLVRSAGAGRLSLHAAIRACVLAMCPISDNAQVDYLEHYRQRMGTLASLARSKSVRPMRQFLRDDVAHVQHAWQLALQGRALPTLLSLAESLWFLNGGVVVNSGYLEDFVQAERLLGDDLSVAPALRALLLAGVAQAACRDGHFDLAMQRSRQAQHLARQARHRDALIYASDNLIQVYVRQRKLRQAEALMRKTAALHYQPDGEACFPPNGLNHQRQLCFLRSDFEAYLRLSDEMIDICRRFEDSEDETRVMLSKASVYADAGNLPLAIQALDETLAVAAANGASPALQVSALGLSVRWQLELGHIEPARTCIARANAIAFSAALPHWARLFTGLAKAEFAIATGDTTAAALPLTEALAALSRSELLSLAPEVFLVTARWFLLLKERVACVAMLQAINPEVWEMRTFAAAQKMLRELGEEPRPTSGVAPDEPEAALSAAATIAGRRVLELQLRTQSGHSAVSLLAARAL